MVFSILSMHCIKTLLLKKYQNILLHYRRKEQASLIRGTGTVGTRVGIIKNKGES
jgi:hypothetical protein